ncbi:MAG: RNA methyltransferase [Treponema sp.]|jgi:TrmH RNA methyltransferase|nr:RNA methyltransferase [Treponema sp.]
MCNKLTDELAVCGLNAVLAVGEHHPQTINRLFLREDRLKLLTGVCRQLAERKRPYKICEDEELERVCKSIHHQGVVAMIEEPVIESLSMEDLFLWADEGKTGLVLHSVGNDHNLGAIARAAAFFGIYFIVVNEKDTAFAGAYEDNTLRLTTSAYRVAEGGMEHITIRKISNTAAFLKDASKRIITIGTDTRARMRISDLSKIVKDAKVKPFAGRSGQEDRPPQEIPGITNGLTKGTAKGIALILGNEETGLPENVKDQCTYLLRIPGSGNIESLNVAQAAALFMHAVFEA